ncbi:MAG: phosphatase PAP2 family protein [Deltaproteobacteria bacterium]|nr:MAG: phosphatase PAP2 family protein [Deltaproteobacteria bacterium]
MTFLNPWLLKHKRLFLSFLCFLFVGWSLLHASDSYADKLPQSSKPKPSANLNLWGDVVPRDSLWSHRHWGTVGSLAVGIPAAMIALKLIKISPNANSVIGPQFDFGTHSPKDPSNIAAIQKPFAEKESVPTSELALFWLGSMAGATAINAIPICNTRDKMCRFFHHQMVFDTIAGALETFFLTVTITETFKYGFGRLRPDFLDRYERFQCQNNPKEKECVDGQLSFISGHSSSSFAMATYASLVIGGRLVWGRGARNSQDHSGRIAGLFMQASLLGIASYIAASRIQDGRHHIEDVVVGSLVGFGVANLSYWLYFDHDGLPRFRGQRNKKAGVTSVSVAPMLRGLQLQVAGFF